MSFPVRPESASEASQDMDEQRVERSASEPAGFAQQRCAAAADRDDLPVLQLKLAAPSTPPRIRDGVGGHPPGAVDAKTAGTGQFLHRIGESQRHKLHAGIGMDSDIMVVRLDGQESR